MSLYKKGLKGKLDAIFSLYIRTRDKWTCRRCLKPQPYKSKGYHCCHMRGRKNESLRWSEINCFGMDYGCHSFIDSNPHDKEAWYVSQFGQETWDNLVIEGNQTVHLKDWQIQEKIEYYEKKLAELAR